MTWEVFLGISAIVSFVVLIGKPIYSSAKNTATMATELKNFNENFERFRAKNEEEHNELWDKNDEQDEHINDHEKRIWHIEHIREDAYLHERENS